MKSKKPLIIALVITLVCSVAASIFLLLSEHNTQQARNEAFQNYQSAKKAYNAAWDDLETAISTAENTYNAYTEIQEKHPETSITKELNNSALQLQQELDSCRDLSKINLPKDSSVQEMRVAQIQKLQTRLKSETKKLATAKTELSAVNDDVNKSVKTLRANDDGLIVQKAALDPTKINGTWCSTYPNRDSDQTGADSSRCINIDWPLFWHADQDRSEGVILAEIPASNEPGVSTKLLGECFSAHPVTVAATGEPIEVGGFAFYYCAKADQVNPSQIRYLPGFDENPDYQKIMDMLNSNPDRETVFSGHSFAYPFIRQE